MLLPAPVGNPGAVPPTVPATYTRDSASDPPRLYASLVPSDETLMVRIRRSLGPFATLMTSLGALPERGISEMPLGVLKAIDRPSGDHATPRASSGPVSFAGIPVVIGSALLAMGTTQTAPRSVKAISFPSGESCTCAYPRLVAISTFRKRGSREEARAAREITASRARAAATSLVCSG